MSTVEVMKHPLNTNITSSNFSNKFSHQKNEIMPCVIKDDECYEQIIDDPYNPNEYQPTEVHDSNYIKKLIEVSSTTIYNSAHAENEVETM